MTENDTPPDNTPAAPAATSSALDLTDLRMMPAWVSSIGGGGGGSVDISRFEEREDRGPRRDGFGGDRRGAPAGRRDGPPPRRDGGGAGFGGGDRPRGPGGPGGPGQGQGRGAPRRDGPPGARPGPGGPRGGGDRDQRGGPRRFGDRGRDDRPQRDWVEMPRDIQVVIEPEDKSAEALAGHIRGTGHAFSMFDAARLVLAEGDRFHARYTCAAERPAGLFATNDGGLFLNRDEALQHVLRSKALDAFYRAEEVELEEPKGDFKSMGVCGMSGELLGPPSHHSFQSSIIRLHRERFSNMALEDFKRRVRVEANPELVTQWKEKLKKGYRWVWLKDTPAEGAEPLALNSRAEMEAHFRRFHAEESVVEKRDALVIGNVDKSKLTHVLFIMLRQGVDNARKHLFDMSQKLGSSFERRGLKLFKRRAGKLFVSRVKPKAIDPGVIFSERVSKIVEVLKGKSGIMLHDLVEAIVPSAAPVVSEAPAVEGEAPAAPAKLAPTEEQIGVIKDIRWLANEGYVIEYSDGMVFLGVQGEPQPAPKAPAATAAKEIAAPAAESEAPSEVAEEASAEAEPEAEEVIEPLIAEEALIEEAPAVAEEASAETEPEVEEVVEPLIAEETPVEEAPVEAAAAEPVFSEEAEPEAKV